MEAIARLKPRFGDRAKAVIIDRCSRGLLDGRGEIVVRAYENCSTQAWEGYLERYVDVQMEDTRHTKSILTPDFWSAAFAEAPTFFEEGASDINRTVWADWEIGDFGYRCIWPSLDIAGIERCDVAGMRFNGDQLALLATPPSSPHLLVRPRTALYDWESAIIDLAGTLSQGLLIPDAFEHGAQAKLERWLQDWFAEHCDAHPVEATVRPKAKRILEAIQREQKATD